MVVHEELEAVPRVRAATPVHLVRLRFAQNPASASNSSALRALASVLQPQPPTTRSGSSVGASPAVAVKVTTLLRACLPEASNAMATSTCAPSLTVSANVHESGRQRRDHRTIELELQRGDADVIGRVGRELNCERRRRAVARRGELHARRREVLRGPPSRCSRRRW